MPTNYTFPPRLAELGFSMDIPDGFIEAPIPPDDIDFSDPTKSGPLAVLSSQVALAVIAVAARPAYEDGTVLDWLRFLSGQFQIDLQHVQVRGVGKNGTHPGITAFGVQYQDGTKLHLMLIAFEDGGRLVTAHGMCPAELWPSYGTALSNAVESITLTNPRGPTHPVDNKEVRDKSNINDRAVAAVQIQQAAEAEAKPPSKRGPSEVRSANDPIEAAIIAARNHLTKDEFEQAEQAIQKVDSSIQGNVKLQHLYKDHLRSLVGSKDKARVERVFFRTLSWAQSCYPEPHTQIEADQYEAGRAEDRADLVKILGYDPEPSR